MGELVRMALRPHIVRNAFKVSAVVGTILNIINQGGNLIDGVAISWPHVLMNYIVPYCVSSYSAAKNELIRRTQQ